MFPSRFAALLFALQISACGGKALDLGGDQPAAGPSRLEDGGIDEKVPWAITGHPTGARTLAADATRVYWGTDDSVKGCRPGSCSRTTITYQVGSKSGSQL